MNSRSDVVEEQARKGQSNEVEATSKNQQKSDSVSFEPQNKQMEQGAEPEKTIDKIIPEESKEPVLEDDAEGSSLLDARNRVVNDKNVGK